MNRSAVVNQNDSNLSFSRHNTSALDISTNKIVEEKGVIQKKYGKLKEDYLKLKNAYEKIKSNAGNVNGEEDKVGVQEIGRLKSALSAMEMEKEHWKERAEGLAVDLRKQR